MQLAQHLVPKQEMSLRQVLSPQLIQTMQTFQMPYDQLLEKMTTTIFRKSLRNLLPEEQQFRMSSLQNINLEIQILLILARGLGTLHKKY